MTEQNPNPEPNVPANPEANPATPPKTEESPKVTFTDEQQKELNKLIANARREGKAAAEKDANDVKAKAEADAERSRQEAAGEYEKAKTTLTAERDTAASERDGYKGKLETLLADLKPEIEKAWAGLPAEVSALYEGEDDDVLAKRSFMTKHAALIEKLAGKVEEEKQKLRTPRTPVPNLKDLKEELTPLVPAKL